MEGAHGRSLTAAGPMSATHPTPSGRLACPARQLPSLYLNRLGTPSAGGWLGEGNERWSPGQPAAGDVGREQHPAAPG